MQITKQQKLQNKIQQLLAVLPNNSTMRAKIIKLIHTHNLTQLANNFDTLLSKTKRIMHGDFFTPVIWAKQADKYMDKVISPTTLHHNFHHDALIWDCACGTGNLTADMGKYRHLNCSTLSPQELSTGILANQFLNAQHVFTYDFLNNLTLPKFLDKELVHAHQINQPVVFYTNPPYGTANNYHFSHKYGKQGIAKNKINQMMNKNKCGRASQQLYAQFYYRAYRIIQHYNLKNAYICFFTQPQFLVGGSYWNKFNTKVLDKFQFKGGFMFSGAEFKGVHAKWPVGFTIFKYVGKPVPKNTYILITKIQKNHQIINTGKHVFNQFQHKDSLSKQVRLIKPKKFQIQSAPQMSSGLNVSHGKNPKGVFYKNSLGYLFFAGDNVEDSAKSVWLTTSTVYVSHGVNIMPNLKDLLLATSCFTVRRLMKNFSWFNALDNFKKINLSSKDYPQFAYDSLIFALFNGKSNQTSLRLNGYSNLGISNCWNNRWFWLSHYQAKKQLQLYEQHTHQKWVQADNDMKYAYVQEPYIAQIIYKYSHQFSKQAIKVLQSATQVWKDSFKYRQTYSKQHPNKYEYTWDLGWYQILYVLRDKTIKTQIKNNQQLMADIHQFKVNYKKLGQQLKPYVFKLGCL